MPNKQVAVVGSGIFPARWLNIPYQYADKKCGIYSKEFKMTVSEKIGMPLQFLIFEYFNGNAWAKTRIRNEVQRKVKVRVKIDPHYANCIDDPLDVFLVDISKLLQDRLVADFVLKTSKGTRIFMVHKAFLATRSSVFHAMFRANMSEVSSGEAVIDDLDDETLSEMIHFLYTGHLSGSHYDIVSLCYAADKYDLPSLFTLICLHMNSVALDAPELADLFIASDLFSQSHLFDIAFRSLCNGMNMLKDVLSKMKDHTELIIKIFLATQPPN